MTVQVQEVPGRQGDAFYTPDAALLALAAGQHALQCYSLLSHTISCTQLVHAAADAVTAQH